MLNNQISRSRLAGRTATPRLRLVRAGDEDPTTTATRAARYRELLRAVIPPGTFAKREPGRSRQDELSAGTAKLNPMGDAAHDLLWRVRLRLQKGHDPLDVERAAMAPVLELAGDVRALCRAAADAVPCLELAHHHETREQGEADHAMSLVFLLARKRASAQERLAAVQQAIRENNEHAVEIQRTHDALCAERQALLMEMRGGRAPIPA